jgi:hypothetical protein
MPEVDRVAMIVDEGGDPHAAAAYDFRLKRSGWKVCHVHAIDGPAAEEAQLGKASMRGSVSSRPICTPSFMHVAWWDFVTIGNLRPRRRL